MRIRWNRIVFAAPLLAGAAFLAAQTAPPKAISGTVTEFRPDALELGVQPDSGKVVFVKFGVRTEVVQIPPGERDLSKARPASVTGILRGDRVLISFVGGMEEARRIVLIARDDIARRNEAERQDWKDRGISGVVSANNGDEIVLEIRSPDNVKITTVSVTAKTVVRRYAPDSVKFAEAEPAKVADIAKGDQLRTRGKKNEDGSRVTAEDVVFGTFLTSFGSVSAVNREAGEVVIEDLTTKKPLTIRVTADSHLKTMPDMRTMMFSKPKKDAAPPPRNMAEMLEQLPACRIDDLKVGSTIVVTSTRGSRPGQVTAITLITGVEPLIQMAQAQAAASGRTGLSATEALNLMHGGMMSGPGGFSLPVM